MRGLLMVALLGPSPALSRADVALVASAPVVLALGRVLLVPFDDQDWDHMLSDMATHSFRNAIGWSLTLVAAAAVVLGAGAVLSLIGAPGPLKPIAVAGAVLLLGAHALILRSFSHLAVTKGQS